MLVNVSWILPSVARKVWTSLAQGIHLEFCATSVTFTPARQVQEDRNPLPASNVCCRTGVPINTRMERKLFS